MKRKITVGVKKFRIMTRPRKPETQERRLWLSSERRTMNKVYKRLQKEDDGFTLGHYKSSIETVNDKFLKMKLINGTK